MDLTGKIIDDKYKIIKLIGTGGMAKVYKALDIRLERYVAVKVLKEDYSDNEQFVKKFMREAQADAKLAHPNIVNVYDVGASDGVSYIVMEYMDGPSLNEYMNKKGVLSPQETVDLIYTITLGLNHAHVNKIIHRDIKPHNILMTTSHMPKVADFGIAMAVSSSTLTATEEGDGLGSVHYVSPEQAKGGFLDERSDLYSLGIMMYEMLTGELPYDGDSPVAVALMHVQNQVPNPQSINKKVPDGVAQVVMNLTRKKPEERYQNARALLEVLRKLKTDINAEIEPTYKGSQKFQGKIKPNKAKAKAGAKKNGTSLPGGIDKKKAFIIIGIFAAVAAVVLAIALLIPPKMVKVPKFVGLSESAAKELAAENDLKVNINTHVSSPDIDEGLIAKQSVDAGKEVKAKSVIELSVSTGPKIVEVPEVLKKYEKEAISMLENKNFIVKEVLYEFNDDYENGVVYEQNPAAGTQAAEGTEVVLHVSKGKDTVSVPKLLGQSLSAARTLLAESGLNMGSVSYDTSSTYEKDTIMKQSPTAYSVADKKASIDVVISLGAETTHTLTVDLSHYTDPSGGATCNVRIEMQNVSGSYETVFSRESVSINETVSVPVSGIGDRIYYVYINSVKVYEGVISF